MKLLLSISEAQTIIEAALKEKGQTIKSGSMSTVSHTEGLYDEATVVFDGFSIEIE
jgi:hypothetical protein